MDWDAFSSQSAPEPGMHQRRDYLEHAVSQSVPESYSSRGIYQMHGFATHCQGSPDDQQPIQPLSNVHAGAGTHPQRQAHHIPFQHHNPMSNATMSMYYQGQSLAYQATQLEPNSEGVRQTVSLLPGHDFDMDELYEHGPYVYGSNSGPNPHQLTTGIAGETYLTYPHPSPTIRPTDVMATPQYSPLGSSLPSSPSPIHERYTTHRLATTSGDFCTTGSVLFAEDAPQPTRKPPLKINHYVAVEPMPQTNRNTFLKRVMRSASPMDEAVPLEQNCESPGTPIPEGGVESFCENSFSRHKELRDALRSIMNSKMAESQDLYQFLKINDEKMWECLFERDGILCGRWFKRRDKAVGHIYQVHIKMFPVACNGDCGNPKCSRRFSSAALKSSHARKGSVQCGKCKALTSGRNISRHHNTKKCKRVATAIASMSK